LCDPVCYLSEPLRPGYLDYRPEHRATLEVVRNNHFVTSLSIVVASLFLPTLTIRLSLIAGGEIPEKQEKRRRMPEETGNSWEKAGVAV
jgi:hypothetical protein